mmetsp:Transcript_43270/g.101452  ORF Transcript_43270/g.101452 Transcript_43270/m.101452 type:complete len:227 (-) Transcript_43270:12-692(-)
MSFPPGRGRPGAPPVLRRWVPRGCSRSRPFRGRRPRPPFVRRDRTRPTARRARCKTRRRGRILVNLLRSSRTESGSTFENRNSELEPRTCFFFKYFERSVLNFVRRSGTRKWDLFYIFGILVLRKFNFEIYATVRRSAVRATVLRRRHALERPGAPVAWRDPSKIPPRYLSRRALRVVPSHVDGPRCIRADVCIAGSSERVRFHFLFRSFLPLSSKAIAKKLKNNK